jgi:hypothetical protein
MPTESSTGTDLIIDVLVLAGVIALIPNKHDLPEIILISFILISIVAMESRIRRFKLTGYMDEGVSAFRPMYWATALLLFTLYYKPYPGLDLWGGHAISFFLSTMLVFLAMLLVAYRAAAHHN